MVGNPAGGPVLDATSTMIMMLLLALVATVVGAESNDLG
jgi:hypothetical protein